MDYPQNLSKSDQRWFDLIQQCRTSGKSDRQWLIDNNIKSGSFYYHIKRLREKACEIPMSSFARGVETHEVVPLVINEDLPLPESDPVISGTVAASNEVALRLTIQNVTVEITNQATQSVIQNTLSALRSLC